MDDKQTIFVWPYDMIEEGQNKTAHLLISKSIKMTCNNKSKHLNMNVFPQGTLHIVASTILYQNSGAGIHEQGRTVGHHIHQIKLISSER